MEVDGCGYGLGWGGVEWMTTLKRGRGLRGHCRESASFFLFQGRWMDGDMELWMWISKCG